MAVYSQRLFYEIDQHFVPSKEARSFGADGASGADRCRHRFDRSEFAGQKRSVVGCRAHSSPDPGGGGTASGQSPKGQVGWIVVYATPFGFEPAEVTVPAGTRVLNVQTCTGTLVAPTYRLTRQVLPRSTFPRKATTPRWNWR
ncbi:MAG: hypothetical protein HY774_07565 [Acidobacteria bacterium]|nr:hypothetical protein [Acidobacteriota bacterium]